MDIICLMKMCSFFSEIENISILINYGGYWKENIYNDGYLDMVFVPKKLFYILGMPVQA